MAERTLYDLLELSSTASPEAIQAAYERLASKFDPARPENAANAGAKMQHDAVKQAFLTLSNPHRRKQYDSRLIQARVPVQYGEVVEPFWTLPKLIVTGIVLVAAASFYYSHQKEQTRLARVEAERQIAAAKAKEAEENARVEVEQARLDAQRKRQEQLSEDRFWRERQATSRQLAVEQQRQAGVDARDRAQAEAAERRAESQRRAEESQAQYAARQQLAREKAELCRLERERYGKAISC